MTEHFSPWPVLLISEDLVVRQLLQEAFAPLDVSILVVQATEAIQEDKWQIVIALINSANKQKMISLAEHLCVIALDPDRLLGGDDKSFFEKTFFPPYRMGHVVECIRYARQQFAYHQTLKPLPFGDYLLMPKDSVLIHNISGKKAILTDKELDIIMYLYHAQRGISRQKLLQDVWRYAPDTETHTMETHIYRLRQKLKNALGREDIIITSEDGYGLFRG